MPVAHGKHALYETRLLVIVVAWQPAIDLIEAQLGKDRDAVEALLAVGFDVVAK